MRGLWPNVSESKSRLLPLLPPQGPNPLAAEVVEDFFGGSDRAEPQVDYLHALFVGISVRRSNCISNDHYVVVPLVGVAHGGLDAKRGGDSTDDEHGDTFHSEKRIEARIQKTTKSMFSDELGRMSRQIFQLVNDLRIPSVDQGGGATAQPQGMWFDAMFEALHVVWVMLLDGPDIQYTFFPGRFDETFDRCNGLRHGAYVDATHSDRAFWVAKRILHIDDQKGRFSWYKFGKWVAHYRRN